MNTRDMLDQSCENYLMKMKYDTRDFNELPMIKGNFNTTGHGSADPFLVQMSVGHKVVAGSDIRSLK